MEKYLFALTNNEVQEIRNCGQIYFSGGSPEADNEIKDCWLRKWKYFFESCFTCIDARYGNLLAFPFSGGAMEQPIKTMQVYSLIRDLYREKIQREMEKAIK